MKALVTDAEIASLLALAGVDFEGANLNGLASQVEVALRELQAHRADARARRALPLFVPGQPSEGEIMEAIGSPIFVAANPTEEGERRSVEMLRGVIREVLHLRQHVTHVQTVARGERDRRMAAEANVAKLTVQRDALTVAVLRLNEAGATSPNVVVGERTPLWEPPISDRSERWREAQARIEAATEAGKDAAQADMDIVLEEHMKHLGFEP